jgi:WD40 repeat protein
MVDTAAARAHWESEDQRALLLEGRTTATTDVAANEEEDRRGGVWRNNDILNEDDEPYHFDYCVSPLDLLSEPTILEDPVNTATLSRVSSSENTVESSTLDDSSSPHHLGPLPDLISDDELASALQSLHILGDDYDDNNHRFDIDHYDDHLGPLQLDQFPDALPELEFTGADDPLLASFLQGNDDDDDLPFDDTLWLDGNDVNDDDNDDNVPLPLELLSDKEDEFTRDIMKQLAQLALDKDTIFANESQAQSEAPLSFTAVPSLATLPERSAVPSPSRNDSDSIDYDGGTRDKSDDVPILYCQPCNDPSSIPPPPPPSWWHTPTEEETWALAAAAVFAEQVQGDNELVVDHDEMTFWQEQVRLLSAQSQQQEHMSSSVPTMQDQPDPFDLFDSNPDNELAHDNVDPTNAEIPATATGRHHLQPTPATTVVPTVRPGALQAAQPYVQAFGAALLSTTTTPSDSVHQPPHRATTARARECFGHKERVLGCDISSCGQYLATASQDATVRVWSMASHRQLACLTGHNPEHECLRVAWASPQWAADQVSRSSGTRRHSSKEPALESSPVGLSFAYLLVSGGADGVVHVWGCHDPATQEWVNWATLDHSLYQHVVARSTQVLMGIQKGHSEAAEDKPVLDDDKPQIYSLQFIDHWAGLPPRSRSWDGLAEGIGGGDEGDKATNFGNSFLLTSSDEYVHLWELDERKLHKKTKTAVGAASLQWQFREVLSLRFGPWDGPAYGVTLRPVTEDCALAHQELSAHSKPAESHADNAGTSASGFVFGGERNVKNTIFVFDASYCPANGLLGAALSDGTLRLVNGRGVCLSVLQLPGCQSHLTSFSWDSTGERLATTVATGHLITWGIQIVNTLGSANTADASHRQHSLVSDGIRATCRAVMEGGHVRGRPLYGTRFIANDELLTSWGSDGRVCLWDSQTYDDEVDQPMAILWDNNGDSMGEGYPVFALALTPKTAVKVVESSRTNGTQGESTALPEMMLSIAIAGGGSTSGFLGNPVYLYDVYGLFSDEDNKAVQGSSKRTKQEQT